MRLLNLRINFYLLRAFCPHLDRVFFVPSHYFGGRSDYLKKARGEIWPKRSEKKQEQKKKKTTKMRTKSPP